jgi:N-sulfoglucosamine sulfohydrolase
VVLPPYYPDHPVTGRDWADYLECAQVLDRKVGVVLRRLEEDGLSENTIVVFFGDHGRAHVRGKQSLYEGGIHVPLIIRWPGEVEGGSVNEEAVSAIDLAPTCLSLVGVEPPRHLDGIPLLGHEGSALTGRRLIFAARDRCDETYDGIRCVRDKRFKYIHNLADDPVHRERHLPNHRRVMEGRGLPPEPSPHEYLAWWERQLLTHERRGRASRSRRDVPWRRR